MQSKTDMIKKIYPVGTMIELDCMDDPQAPPKGTQGEVIHIDSIGQLHIAWENGSGLALVYGVDKFHKI